MTIVFHSRELLFFNHIKTITTFKDLCDCSEIILFFTSYVFFVLQTKNDQCNNAVFEKKLLHLNNINTIRRIVIKSQLYFNNLKIKLKLE